MGNSKGRRRRFGTVRRLPSGRWQARYPGPDGLVRPADDTFATKTGAETWLTRKEAEILDGDWIDPDAGEILISDYAATWIEERPGLRPKTVRNYRGLLRSQVAPHLADVTVGELTLARVRRWRKKLLDSGTSPITTAKAYRFLRAVMNTAVDDGLISATHAGSKGPVLKTPRSALSYRSHRSTPWPMRSGCATGRWSCWPRSLASGGVSWPRCARKTSTWPPVPCG
jgi:Phage integrase, N-terminal SAM-like domain